MRFLVVAALAGAGLCAFTVTRSAEACGGEDPVVFQPPVRTDPAVQLRLEAARLDSQAATNEINAQTADRDAASMTTRASQVRSQAAFRGEVERAQLMAQAAQLDANAASSRARAASLRESAVHQRVRARELRDRANRLAGGGGTWHGRGVPQGV